MGPFGPIYMFSCRTKFLWFPQVSSQYISFLHSYFKSVIFLFSMTGQFYALAYWQWPGARRGWLQKHSILEHTVSQCLCAKDDICLYLLLILEEDFKNWKCAKKDSKYSLQLSNSSLWAVYRARGGAKNFIKFVEHL